MNPGHEIIFQELTALGHTPKVYPDEPNYPGGFIAFTFKVPIGKFRGKEIEVALNAPQFPAIPPSGPYISPLLLPFKSGSVPPYDGIHQRQVPTGDFQYWSRPFNGWADVEKNMKTYIAFLRTLFDFE
jgi:hypothetical protein